MSTITVNKIANNKFQGSAIVNGSTVFGPITGQKRTAEESLAATLKFMAEKPAPAQTAPAPKKSESRFLNNLGATAPKKDPPAMTPATSAPNLNDTIAALVAAGATPATIAATVMAFNAAPAAPVSAPKSEEIKTNAKDAKASKRAEIKAKAEAGLEAYTSWCKANLAARPGSIRTFEVDGETRYNNPIPKSLSFARKSAAAAKDAEGKAKVEAEINTWCKANGYLPRYA